MKRKRCIAFKQSVDYPELFMPCTDPAFRGSKLCNHHAVAVAEVFLFGMQEVVGPAIFQLLSDSLPRVSAVPQEAEHETAER